MFMIIGRDRIYFTKHTLSKYLFSLYPPMSKTYSQITARFGHLQPTSTSLQGTEVKLQSFNCDSNTLQPQSNIISEGDTAKREGSKIEIPSFSEIQNSLQILKTYANEAISNELIDFVYMRAGELRQNPQMASKKDYSELIQGLKERLYAQMQTIIASKQDQSNQMSAVEHAQRYSQVMNYNESSFDQSSRTKESQRFIGIAYCNGVSTYNLLLQQIQMTRMGITITKNDYSQAMGRMLGQVYQQLQNIVKENNKLQPVNKQESKRIMTLLQNCKNTLPPQQCQTIYKMLRNVLQVTNTSIDRGEAIQLYEEIHSMRREKEQRQTTAYSHRHESKKLQRVKKQLNARIRHGQKRGGSSEASRRSRQSYDLHNQWSSQYEKQLLQQYKQTNNFGTIRDRFRAKYPNSEKLFTSQSLRSKLYKLIRAAVRRLLEVAQSTKSSIPPLCKLDDNRVKAIIYYQQGRNIKLQLLDFYSAKQPDSKILGRTILAVNDYISKMEHAYSSFQGIPTPPPAPRKRRSESRRRRRGKKHSKVIDMVHGEPRRMNYRKLYESQSNILQGLDNIDLQLHETKPKKKKANKDDQADISSWIETEFK